MRESNKRVLLAGCGRLGLLLAPQLAASQYHVTALSRRKITAPGVHQSFTGDLISIQSLSNLGTDFDAIVYSPTPDQRDTQAYRHVFCDGLSHLLQRQTLNHSGRLVFVSSTAVYAQNSGEWVTENNLTEPHQFNGQVLLEAEQIALQSKHTSSIVRLAGLYGNNSNYLLKKLIRGDITASSLNGWTNRIHLVDAARLIAHMLINEQHPHIINGVDNYPCQRSELFHWLIEQVSSKNISAIKPEVQAIFSENTANIPQQTSTGKRVSNQLALSLDFQFNFPDFRAGYRTIIEHWLSTTY